MGEGGTSGSAAAGRDPWWDRRWRGQAGRLEVWYATGTDRRTGAGWWVHGETVSPTDGSGAHAHGWAAFFPVDGDPVWQRTPRTPDPPRRGSTGADPRTYSSEDLVIGPGGTRGRAGGLEWDLAWDRAGQVPLSTFPAWAWHREALPAAQVVPAPALEVGGTFSVDGRSLDVAGPGQVARIYGHGNARRWAWLHADLGGGDVVELVSAVSTRPGLRLAPPVTMLRMRLGGVDWPPALLAPLGLRARLDLPRWTVRGRVRGWNVTVEVDQPPDRCVRIPYADPDGATATCTNTERADLRLTLARGGGWERTWLLRGTAHAEVGTRP